MNRRTGIVIGVIAGVALSVAAVLTFTASPDIAQAQITEEDCGLTLTVYSPHFEDCVALLMHRALKRLKVEGDAEQRTITVTPERFTRVANLDRSTLLSIGWRVRSVDFKLHVRVEPVGGGSTWSESKTATREQPAVFTNAPAAGSEGTVYYYMEARLAKPRGHFGPDSVTVHVSGKGSVDFEMLEPPPPPTPRPTRVPDTDIVYAEVTRGDASFSPGTYHFTWRTTGRKPHFHALAYRKLDRDCDAIGHWTFVRYNGHATSDLLQLSEPESGLPNSQSWQFILEAGTDSVYLFSRSACGPSRIGHAPPTEIQTGVDPNFSEVPVAHDGHEFNFKLWFSAEPEADFSYVNMRDDVLNVTGGEVVGANRLNRPSNRGWLIIINPDGNPDVVVTLPTTTDCNLDSAVCDDQGVPLGDTGTITVPRDD